MERLVVVGDSVLAGFASGGLVRHGNPGQGDGAAALLARSAGVRLLQPSIDQPGAPPQLAAVDADRDGWLDPGEVRRDGAGLGTRKNPNRRTWNLSVPGETLETIFESVGRDDLHARDAAIRGRLRQRSSSCSASPREPRVFRS
jgi:hypothetical protein